jgi:hypothetical protein
MVVDAAVERAIAAPLHESVRAAAERAAEQENEKKRKGATLTQTKSGMHVTEMIPEFEKKQQTDDASAEAKRQKKASDACKAAAKQDEKVKDACTKLIYTHKGDDKKLAIGDLVTLIKWKGGKVPGDITGGNKEAVVQAWRDLKVAREVLSALAGEGAAVPGKPKAKPKATKKKKKTEEDDASSDEEDVSDDDDASEDEEEDCEDEDSEERDGEESEEEEEYGVQAILAQRGKGHGLEYHVKWEGYEEPTWQPAADLACQVGVPGSVLELWLASRKK